MTGYGSAEIEGYRVEARSLNHKYLEINIKGPASIYEYERAIRDEVKKRFQRGKFDISISITDSPVRSLSINEAMAEEIARALKTLRDRLSLEGGIRLSDILIWREAIIREEVEGVEAERLLRALDSALKGVEEMRLKEGEALGSAILSELSVVEGIVRDIEAISPRALETERERFIERTKGFLPTANISELLVEAGRAAEDSDITEEVVRIKSHIGYMRKILSEGGKIGKTLDFVLQELYRESNTIASKSQDIDIIRSALLMKASIEGMREQVQNIQ